VQFNNAYGVRVMAYRHEYYLTDAKRRGQVLRVFADDTVEHNEFTDIISTFRFAR
jgi:hypothetical protein